MAKAWLRELEEKRACAAAKRAEEEAERAEEEAERAEEEAPAKRVVVEPHRGRDHPS